MDLSQALKGTKDAMDKSVAYVSHEFETVHTGKASPSMVENVMVEAYGTTSRLKDIAAITTPDSSTIRVQPWDKSILKDVEKAILSANIGFTPAVMGDAVRCPIPALSGERRAELAKICHEMAEQGRVRVRNVRRESIDAFKKTSKKSDAPRRARNGGNAQQKNRNKARNGRADPRNRGTRHGPHARNMRPGGGRA